MSFANEVTQYDLIHTLVSETPFSCFLTLSHMILFTFLCLFPSNTLSSLRVLPSLTCFLFSLFHQMYVLTYESNSEFESVDT